MRCHRIVALAVLGAPGTVVSGANAATGAPAARNYAVDARDVMQLTATTNTTKNASIT
jgi:hypothetical protein